MQGDFCHGLLVPQCGYCQPGMMMGALDLLQSNPAPTREEIVTHMNTNPCRCGTCPTVVKAIERAAVPLISAVIADGELYDAAAIEELLADVLASSRRLL